jgi:hypothetical protein
VNCASHDAHFQLYEQSKQAMRASFGHMERPDIHETRPTVEKVLQVTKEILFYIIVFIDYFLFIVLFIDQLFFNQKKGGKSVRCYQPLL